MSAVHGGHHGAVLAPADALAAGAVVVEEILRHVAVDGGEVFLVHEVVKMLSDETFVVLGIFHGSVSNRGQIMRRRTDVRR